MAEADSIRARITEFVQDELVAVTGRKPACFNEDTVLFGAAGNIKSREVVELMLAIEDFMVNEFELEFDWASDSAMSDQHSVFRSVRALVDHLTDLVTKQA